MPSTTSDSTTSAMPTRAFAGTSGRASGVHGSPRGACPVRSRNAKTTVTQNTIWTATIRAVPTPATIDCATVSPPRKYCAAPEAMPAIGTTIGTITCRTRRHSGYVCGPMRYTAFARVPRRQGVGIAELHEGSAFGGVRRRPVGALGLDGVEDERPDLGLQVLALGLRHGAQDAPDVAVGERGHQAVPPWPRRRTDASIRSHSASSSAAKRSPSGLMR